MTLFFTSNGSAATFDLYVARCTVRRNDYHSA
jgi:hypothetical protein